MEPELEVLEVAEKAVPCRQVTLVFLLHLELLILAAVVVADIQHRSCSMQLLQGQSFPS